MLLTQEGARHVRLDPYPADRLPPCDLTGDTYAMPSPAIEGRPGRGRKILRAAASAALIAATFGFAIAPRAPQPVPIVAIVPRMTVVPMVLMQRAERRASFMGFPLLGCTEW